MNKIFRVLRRRLNLESGIHYFFGAHALVALVVLGLISIFLAREGMGFFGQNLASLRLYRKAGLEYVDKVRSQVEGQAALGRVLQEIRLAELQQRLARGEGAAEANAALGKFDAFVDAFDEAGSGLNELASEWSEQVVATKERAKLYDDAVEEAHLLGTAEVKAEPVDFAAEVKLLLERFPEYEAASAGTHAALSQLLEQGVALEPGKGAERYESFKKGARVYLAAFPAVAQEMKAWNYAEPVPWTRGVTSFLFGKQWITNSFWQDCYGILPLLSGSLLVSLVAMALAVPLGLAAAIYVSEVAGEAERRLVKPYLEFISAIPSVVLGFFGIAVLGELIRTVTRWEWLSWMPGFPAAERLNVFTAGSLLALMAIPTIFTLAEDALASVPGALREGSYAMGATRLQTIMRVLVPAALSGMVSAVLLGFGRVIGETMVVLLCAGNRIAIPEFSNGLATLFEPVHTMTGIIAQEMGEVVRGSIQYRALFMVGLFLFVLSLGVNWLAQFAVRKLKTH